MGASNLSPDRVVYYIFLVHLQRPNSEMDPLSILSVTCNSLQLVEAAWKLFFNATEIYRSAQGASEGNKMFQDAAARISQLNRAMVDNDDLPEAIRAIAKESHEVSDELLALLKDLTVAEGTKHRKLESFTIAMKESRPGHKGKLSGLIGKLRNLQQEVMAQIQFLILYDPWTP